jgi:hypothetical protein
MPEAVQTGLIEKEDYNSHTCKTKFQRYGERYGNFSDIVWLFANLWGSPPEVEVACRCNYR